jgi:hypothetical protein
MIEVTKYEIKKITAIEEMPGLFLLKLSTDEQVVVNPVEVKWLKDLPLSAALTIALGLAHGTPRLISEKSQSLVSLWTEDGKLRTNIYEVLTGMTAEDFYLKFFAEDPSPELSQVSSRFSETPEAF